MPRKKKKKKKKKKKLSRVGKGQVSGRQASVAKRQKNLGMETSWFAMSSVGAEPAIKPANEPAGILATKDESKPAEAVEDVPGQAESLELQPLEISSTDPWPTQVAAAEGENEEDQEAGREGEETVEEMIVRLYKAGYM